jgi:hypothetical protein
MVLSERAEIIEPRRVGLTATRRILHKQLSEYHYTDVPVFSNDAGA